MNKNEILKYKYFYGSSDFVKWQEDNPNVILTQVIPVLDEVRTNPYDTVKVDKCTEKIFVLYYEQEGEKFE